MYDYDHEPDASERNDEKDPIDMARSCPKTLYDIGEDGIE